MEKNSHQKRVMRPNENEDIRRPNKKSSSSSSKRVNLIRNGDQKFYKFRVLLPNGASLCLEVVDPVGEKMPVVVLADRVKEQYFKMRQSEKNKQRRGIYRNNHDLCLVDSSDKKITTIFDFKNFEPNMLNILRVNDGSKDAETYEELEDDVLKYGISIGQRQEKLKILRGQQLVIEQDLSNIQVTSQSQFHSSAHTMYMKRLIEENKSKLKRTVDEIEEETDRYHREMEKFTESKDGYNKFLDEKVPLLQNLERIFNRKESSSNTPGDRSIFLKDGFFENLLKLQCCTLSDTRIANILPK